MMIGLCGEGTAWGACLEASATVGRRPPTFLCDFTLVIASSLLLFRPFKGASEQEAPAIFSGNKIVAAQVADA